VCSLCLSTASMTWGGCWTRTHTHSQVRVNHVDMM
jgi:hypothetical protein